MSDSLQPHGLQHARLSCLSLSPRVCSNSCPLSWWCQFVLIHWVDYHLHIKKSTNKEGYKAVSKTLLNLVKSLWHDKLDLQGQCVRNKWENFIYLCTCCKIEKNQHILEIGAIIAGLILPVVLFLIVSCVGVDGMGMNDHRISNYPII